MDVIIVEILPKLPVKTLIRFKSVCKFFNSVISSRDFTRLYLGHQSLSSSADDMRLILAGNGRINCYHLDPHATTRTTTFNYRETCPDMSVIGASNGLLCIRLSRRRTIFNTEYWLLNPATRIYQFIHAFDEDARGKHNHGFGFDHENLDYVIVIVSEYSNNSAMKTRITRVYSVNKNSFKVIERTFPKDTMEPPLRRGSGVLIDYNLLHWMFWVPALGEHRIGCFDICKNKWTDDVLLPRSYYDPIEKNYLLDFGAVGDCLFSTFRDRTEKRYNVWVMKEYGVQESWVALLCVPVSDCLKMELVSPVASCQSSEMVLVQQRHTSKLFWYNKVDGGISEAKLDGAPKCGVQTYMCSRSLVDLPDGQLFEHFQVT